MRSAAAALSMATVLAHTATGQAPIARLSGVVLDPHSEPVIAGRVTVEVDGAVLSQAFTDATGRFVVKDVPREGAVVRVTTREPTVGATFVDREVQWAGMVQIQTMPARQLTGRVEADGEPVPGAWVAASPFGPTMLGALAVATTTRADGTFELPCVPCRAITVRAWTKGRYGLETAVDASSAKASELVCELPYPAEVEHTVEIVGADADALNDARLTVVASHAGPRVLLPPELAQPRPEAPGRWRLCGWPLSDDLELRVESTTMPNGRATQRIEPFHAGRRWTFDAASDSPATPHRPPEYDTDTPLPTPIHATISSVKGDPVVGATVIAVPLDRPEQTARQRLRSYRRNRRLIGTTNLRGELVIQPFYPGETEYVLHISSPAGWAEEPFRKNGDEVIDLGVLRCRAGATLRGVVRNHTGAVRPAALLRISTFEPTPRDRFVMTDREGRFSVTGLPPGETVVTHLAGSYELESNPVQLPKSGAVDVTLDR